MSAPISVKVGPKNLNLCGLEQFVDRESENHTTSRTST